MITLPNPITVSTSSVSVPANPKVTYIEDGNRVGARIEGLPALMLWEGEAYKAIGDWTQAQAESRVMELLGSNPAAVLGKL